jgi:hypothetical protein
VEWKQQKMKIIEESPVYRGKISFEIRDSASGKTEKIITVPNVITYQGATVLAKSITGDLQYRITHIYGEYADPAVSGYVAGSTNGLVASKSDTIGTMRSSPRYTEYAESEVITATHYTSGTNYYNNIVTFSASWDDENLDDNLVVGAGLICSIGNSELLYAHAYVPAILKTAGKEIVCHWSQLFI